MSHKFFLPMLLGAMLSGTVLAQNAAPAATQGNQQGQRQRQGGDQGGQQRRGFSPEEFQQRMLERLKEQIGATDEEWQVISPRLQAVTEKQRALRQYQQQGFGRRGPGGQGGQGGQGPQAGPGAQGGQGPQAGPGAQGGQGPQAGPGGSMGQQSAPEVAALQKALETKDANQIKTALEALRTAKKTAQANYQKAGDELRQVLSVNQEAQLVLMGILE